MKTKLIFFLLLLSSFHSYSQTGCISGNCYNGQGTYTWANGNKYVGEFKDDKRNGWGTYIWSTGAKYVGEFKDDKYNGQGTLTYATGEKYVGEFKDDNYNGQGTFTYATGDKYVGEFKDDKYNGQGTFTYATGEKYVGEYKDDKRNGQGTNTLSTGDKYVGEYKDDKRNGQGTLLWNGNKYVGEWKDDKSNGQGTETTADGDKYVGEYKDDKRNGQGTLTWANGYKQEGEWANDGYIGQSTFTVSKTTIPKPTAPANLVLSDIAFNDSKGNSNNILDANEKTEINFRLSNSGKGDAYNVIAKITETNGVKGLTAANKTIGTIKSGETRDISIAVNSTMALLTSRANFKIVVTEGNGFNADPVEIEIVTQEFLKPKVVIADYQFSNEQGGQIKLGVPINLKVVVQNMGQGEAKNVGVKFTIPVNVFASGEVEFNVGNLGVGDKKELNFEFFANKQYSGSSISINAILSEFYEQYAENKTLNVELNQVLTATEKVVVKGELSSAKTFELATLTSDVDKNIPINPTKNTNRYALIIGNEEYTRYQTTLRSESNVAFARNDANVFKQYCVKTLGVTEENITLLIDATAGAMSQAIDRLNKIIKNTNGNAEVIFYYAGHGLPDEKTKEAFLIPVDVSGNNLGAAIKLKTIYDQLTEYPAKRVTVFLDACFTGGGREAGLLAARGIVIKPKADFIKGNIFVFSASSGEQSSLPWKENQHGMFTYFLLKKLQETKGDITYKDLVDYVKSEVSLKSVLINHKEQNPQTNTSSEIIDVWEKWGMK